jgi:hypothetical protein
VRAVEQTAVMRVRCGAGVGVQRTRAALPACPHRCMQPHCSRARNRLLGRHARAATAVPRTNPPWRRIDGNTRLPVRGTALHAGRCCKKRTGGAHRRWLSPARRMARTFGAGKGCWPAGGFGMDGHTLTALFNAPVVGSPGWAQITALVIGV